MLHSLLFIIIVRLTITLKLHFSYCLGSEGFADFSAFSQPQSQGTFAPNFPNNIPAQRGTIKCIDHYCHSLYTYLLCIPVFCLAATAFATFGDAAQPPVVTQNPVAPTPVGPVSMEQHGDRYAALADLDSVFSVVTTSPNVNWNDNSWSSGQQLASKMTTVQASATTNGTAQTNTSTTQFDAAPGMYGTNKFMITYT